MPALPPIPGFDPAKYQPRYPAMRALTAPRRRTRLPAPEILRPCQFCQAESPFGSRVNGRPACEAHRREVTTYRQMMWMAESNPTRFERVYGAARAHELALAEEEQREMDRIAEAYRDRRSACR